MHGTLTAHNRDIVSLNSAFRRYLFGKDVVIEGAKSRRTELGAEIARLETVIREAISQYPGLVYEKALAKLDALNPYDQQLLPEVHALMSHRNVSRSMVAFAEDLDLFIATATDTRCLGIVGPRLLGNEDQIVDLSGDEARFLLNPFDAKRFAEKFQIEAPVVPMYGAATAMGAPRGPWHGSLSQSVADALGGE